MPPAGFEGHRRINWIKKVEHEAKTWREDRMKYWGGGDMFMGSQEETRLNS